VIKNQFRQQAHIIHQDEQQPLVDATQHTPLLCFDVLPHYYVAAGRLPSLF